jgi:hypothetical protein
MWQTAEEETAAGIPERLLQHGPPREVVVLPAWQTPPGIQTGGFDASREKTFIKHLD